MTLVRRVERSCLRKGWKIPGTFFEMQEFFGLWLHSKTAHWLEWSPISVNVLTETNFIDFAICQADREEHETNVINAEIIVTLP